MSVLSWPRRGMPTVSMLPLRLLLELASLVVGAVGLDVAGLLALVANLLARGRGLGAVAREVAGLTTVVALAAVNAIACYVMLAQYF